MPLQKNKQTKQQEKNPPVNKLSGLFWGCSGSTVKATNSHTLLSLSTIVFQQILKKQTKKEIENVQLFVVLVTCVHHVYHNNKSFHSTLTELKEQCRRNSYSAKSTELNSGVIKHWVVSTAAFVIYLLSLQTVEGKTIQILFFLP